MRRCPDNFGETLRVELRKRRSAQRSVECRQLLPGPGGHECEAARGPADQRRCCCGASGGLKRSAHVPIVGMSHPDFAVLTVSWELALRADGYADNTVKAYQNAVRSLAR